MINRLQYLLQRILPRSDVRKLSCMSNHLQCCVPDFTEALFRECFPQRLVEKAFALLTPIQQSRVKQHIFGKKSFAKIAASEGKAKNTVQESYDAAIKKMKKFLKNTLPKGTPYSE